MRQTRTATAISWIAVAAWAGFIFFMSAHTDTGLHEGGGLVAIIGHALRSLQEQLLGPGVDALSPACHFCEYLVLGILLVNALSRHMPLGKALATAIVAASVYGMTDEFHQLFVEGRMCDAADWLVDTAGAAIGASALAGLKRYRARTAESQPHRLQQ